MPRSKEHQHYIKECGRRIRHIRTVQGLTLEELAYRSDASGVAISSWERGDRRATVDQLARVADALGVTVASFLPDDQQIPTPLAYEVVAASLQTLTIVVGELVGVVERIRQHLEGEVPF